jgi:hypothetical protein
MAGPFIKRQVVANDFEDTTRKAAKLTSEDTMTKQCKELWEEFCTIV